MITLKTLELYEGNVYESIKFAEETIGERPSKPQKPILKKDHTTIDVKNYALDLEVYDSKILEYELLLKEHNKKINHTCDIIQQFIKKSARLDLVPVQYQNKLYQYAYREGHSSGYYEVYQILSEIINEIFL